LTCWTITALRGAGWETRVKIRLQSLQCGQDEKSVDGSTCAIEWSTPVDEAEIQAKDGKLRKHNSDQRRRKYGGLRRYLPGK